MQLSLPICLVAAATNVHVLDIWCVRQASESLQASRSSDGTPPVKTAMISPQNRTHLPHTGVLHVVSAPLIAQERLDGGGIHEGGITVDGRRLRLRRRWSSLRAAATIYDTISQRRLLLMLLLLSASRLSRGQATQKGQLLRTWASARLCHGHVHLWLRLAHTEQQRVVTPPGPS